QTPAQMQFVMNLAVNRTELLFDRAQVASSRGRFRLSVDRGRARRCGRSSRRKQSREIVLLQIDGLITPVRVELRTPHLVHALMLGSAEAHGYPESKVQVAQIF